MKMNSKMSFGDLVGATASMAIDSVTPVVSNLIPPDPVSALVSVNASLLEQAAVSSRTSFFPTSDLSDATHSQAFDPLTAFYNPSKLVQLANGTWTSTFPRGTLLSSVLLPSAFWSTAQFPAYGQSRYFKFVRTGYRIRVLVNAAVGCAGCMLMVFIPYNFSVSRYGFDSLLLCPHAFVNLSENSEVELVLPYINFRNYVAVDSGEGGTIRTYVWSPAQFPAGATQEATYSIYGSLISCDFQGPRPQGPVRPRVDIAEGPGSLLLANHQATDAAVKLSLGMEDTFVDVKTSGMVRPVESLKEVMGVAMPMALFTWGATQTAGTNLYQDNMYLGQGGWLLNFLAEHFAYYRGSLKFLITVFVSAFNRGRLRVTWYPTSTTVYNYANSNNSLYSVLDLGVNSSVVLQVPYSSDVWRRNTSTATLFGRLAIWVVNPLAANVTSPSTVNGMIMVAAGEDGEFTVPLCKPVAYQMEREGLLAGSVQEHGPAAAEAAGLSTLSGIGGDPTTDLPQSTPLNVEVVDVPIQTVSHMNLSTYLARATPLGTYPLDRTIQVVPINCPSLGSASLMKMFAYTSGPFTLHFYNKADGHLSLAHTYAYASIPTTRTAGWFASLGMIVVPPGECMSVEIPFYSETPLRCISNDIESTYGPTYGSLVYQSESTTGSLVVWVSFGQVKLFTPIGIPLAATMRSFAERFFPPEPLMLDALEYTLTTGKETVQIPGFNTSRQHQRYKLIYSDEEYAEGENDYVRDLCRECIEKNPGPVVIVVYKSRGLYKHYGIAYDGQVYEMDTENIASSCMTGMVKIKVSQLTNDWVTMTPMDVTEDIVDEIVSSVGSRMRFMVDDNCETFVRRFASVSGFSQSTALAVIGTILTTVGMLSIANPQVSLEDIRTILRTSAEKAQAAATSSMATIYAQFAKLTSMQIVDAVSSEIVTKMCEMLVRVVCYGILYCSCPNFLTTMALGGVILMDFRSREGLGPSLKALLEAMLSGDIMGMAQSFTDLVATDATVRRNLMRESVVYFGDISKDIASVDPPLTPVPTPQGFFDSLHDFNVSSMAGKNLEWWLSRLARFCGWVVSVLDPTESDMARKWLKTHTEEVLGMMATADAVLSMSADIDALRNLEYQKKVAEIRGRLGVIVRLMELARSPDVAPVRHLFRALCVVRKPQPVAEENVRIEPVGIWLQGGVGVGKSFVCAALMDAINAEVKRRAIKSPEDWDQSDLDGYSYSHPGASAYMDLYKGEFFHVIDDFGSTREEKDIVNMAQMCSTCAWQVPMAEISEKGAFYVSKVIIASTNRTDFSSTVLVDSDALRRRFPIQIDRIRPKKAYSRTVTYTDSVNLRAHVLFDATKALQECNGKRAYEDGSCWTYGEDACETELDIMSIAKTVVDMLEEKKAGLRILRSRQRVRKPEDLDLPEYSAAASVLLKEVVDVSSLVDEATEAKRRTKKTMREKLASVFTPEPHMPAGGRPGGVGSAALKRWSDAWANAKLDVSGDYGLAKEECENIGIELAHKVEDLLSRISGIFISPFESFSSVVPKDESPTERLKIWWDGVCARMVNIYEKYGPFLKIASAVMVLTSAVATICTFRILASQRRCEQDVKTTGESPADYVVTDEQRPYAPPVKVRKIPKVAVDLAVPTPHMGVNPSAWSHISRLSGYFEVSGTKYYFLGLRDHTLITFKHVLPVLESCAEYSVWYNGVRSERATISRVVVPNVVGTDKQIDMDICMIEIPNLSYSFRDASKYVASPVPKVDGVVTYADGKHFQSLHVSSVEILDCFVSRYPDGYRNSGLAISYLGHNAKGMCGALVLQMIGGAYKIVGMHFCGDSRYFGYGVRLVDFLAVLPQPQGVVIDKTLRSRTAFVPSHTKLDRSPLYGMVEPEKAPAVLHPKDPRLELPVDNLLKRCADKYHNNVFEVDRLIFENTVTAVTRKVYQATGLCERITMEEAMSGVGGLNPLDLGTSPGLKYVESGMMSKRDLITNDGGVYVASPRLVSDVQSTLQALSRGEMESIEFQTALKDEVRSNAKVALGDTRTIEVCAVDYTIAYRMVMGRMFSNIYSSFCLQTGVAVGINPYIDFHGLYHGLVGKWYALDYKKFDGSLPEGVMRAAVEVLAAAHEEPDMVRAVHEPMVRSKQVVMDEVWTVLGGMPSGSPGTSVVNSVANLLMIMYALGVLGVRPVDVSIVVYGDDVLFSTETQFDSSRVVPILSEAFGMVATSADKMSLEIEVSRDCATFLKRSFVRFPDTGFVVGALDKQTIMQNPQWTRGVREFEQQVESMLFEAVLHGREFYDMFAGKARARLKGFKFFIPDFDAKKQEVYAHIFLL